MSTCAMCLCVCLLSMPILLCDTHIHHSCTDRHRYLFTKERRMHANLFHQHWKGRMNNAAEYEFCTKSFNFKRVSNNEVRFQNLTNGPTSKSTQCFYCFRISALSLSWCDLFGSILCLIMFSDSQDLKFNLFKIIKTQCLRYTHKKLTVFSWTHFFSSSYIIWLTFQAIFIREKLCLVFMLSTLVRVFFNRMKNQKCA